MSLKVNRKLMRMAFPDYSDLFDIKVKCPEYEELTLASYYHQTKGVPQALLFFLPCYGDHSKDYSYFFSKFAEQPLNIRPYCVDRRGFGESQGVRGDVKDEGVTLTDYGQFFDTISYMRGYHHNTPKFLVGHSLGALYAARMCQER